jgi:Aeromonas phage DNA polymerase exonuclease subunit
MKKNQGPKVLILDLETAPILGHVWSLWENNVALNQIERDWFILSFAAKWMDMPGQPKNKIMYMDQSKIKNIEDDTKLLKTLWKLVDEAEIILTQNGKSFDTRKMNARFLLAGMSPPSSYKQIDTLRIAKKHFSLTSHKLEYMSSKLCKKYKKLKHKKFPGFELWKECLARNKAAWKEMAIYNKFDVFSTEELYNVLKPWDNSINFNLYSSSTGTVCTCGASEWQRNGYAYTSVAKYQRYKCKKCSSEIRDRKNLLDKDKKESLKTGTVR